MSETAILALMFATMSLLLFYYVLRIKFLKWRVRTFKSVIKDLEFQRDELVKMSKFFKECAEKRGETFTVEEAEKWPEYLETKD